MNKNTLSVFLIFLVITINGCRWSQIFDIKEEKSDVRKDAQPCSNVYFVKPPELRENNLLDSAIKNYSQYYKGVKIFLDPGHGGTDRKNKGPKGLAVEADLNLKVALYLKDFLERAGAIVELSRTKDTFISLIDRSILANNSNSNIFISIHHNAPGKSGDIYTNYTSTYYHAKQDDYEFDPCDHDIAKYVQRDLAYVMGNSGGLGSFDGTYSDYWIYPGAGFAVLRNTKGPKILIECSFFTSEYEEQRLILEEFNMIQAWGIFRGLGKYLRQGILSVDFSERKEYSEQGTQEIMLDIFDQDKGIDTTFCSAKIARQTVKYEFNLKENKKLLKVIPTEKLKSGVYEINVVIKNINGNHSFPFRDSIIVK